MRTSAEATPRDPIALRMDDIGASSKRYEVYARPLPLPGRLSRVGDILFLKYLPGIGAWGPYPELPPAVWDRIVDLLRSRSAKMTLGITAAWVTARGDLEPFPSRFPAQAERIKAAVEEGLLEVANHGLTHCVVTAGRFLPRAVGSNRTFHREFWEWVPEAVQREHLERSQAILEGWLGRRVVTFVPPGNVFTPRTLALAREVGLRVLSCRRLPGAGDEGLPLVLVDDGPRVVAFHDRDLVMHGTSWLEQKIASLGDRRTCFVGELAAPA